MLEPASVSFTISGSNCTYLGLRLRAATVDRLLQRPLLGIVQRSPCRNRRITDLLHWDGWRVNHKRVERIWRVEGLKVPKKQPKRRRLWFNDGSCIRLRAAHPNHVWSYDFVADRTANGHPIRMLTLVDEFTRECRAIDVAKQLTSEDVLERLSDLFVHRSVPDYIRSDNGPEFTAKSIRDWLSNVGVKILFIERGRRERMAPTRASIESFVMSCGTENPSTPFLKRKSCLSSRGGTTTLAGHTVHWAIGLRHRKRRSPVRLLRLRLSNRKRLVCWMSGD